MTFRNALASPQYSKLRDRSYAGEQLVSLFSNRVVFAGQVNSDLTTPTSWAQFNYNNVSVGAYTDIVINQCLLIGTANDITKATFYGRIRKTPTAAIIYSNESSQDFAVGAYFWVIDNHLPQYKLSRPSTNDPATAIELIDYDVTYAGLLPIIVGLKSAYAGYVVSNNKYRIAFDISGSYAAESGASISSYSYTFKAGTATVVGGATNAAIVVVDLIAGEQWLKVDVTDSGGRTKTRYVAIKVHDTSTNQPDTGFEGGSIEAGLEQGYNFNIPAFAGVDSILNNTCCIVWRNNERYGSLVGGLFGGGSYAVTNKALTSNVATLTAAGHNFQVGQTVIVSDIDSIFNGTYLITATTSSTFSYARTHADVTSAGVTALATVNVDNVDFIGWYQSEDDTAVSDPQFGVLSNAAFHFTGTGARLSRLVAQLLGFTLTASPSVWGEIVNLTPWRGIYHFLSRYTTVADLCDILFDSTDTTFLSTAISTQGGNALAAIQGIAKQINAVVEFAPWGAIGISRDVGHLSSASRSALTTVATWMSDDAVNITRNMEPNPNIGKIDTIGEFYNSSSTYIDVYTARAPGIAQGEAAGTDSLPSQILTANSSGAGAKTELRQRVGNQLLMVNLNEFLEVDHLDGYGALSFIPSKSQLYTWTLDSTLAGANGVNRMNYDTTISWTIDSASQSFDPALGGMRVHVKYRRVTPVGDPGDDTTQNLPAPDSIPDALPDLGFPAFGFEIPLWDDAGTTLANVPPASLATNGKVAQLNGSELLGASTTRALWLKNFIALSTPQYNEVTPTDLGSFTHRSVLVDPFSTTSAVTADLLASDNTNSAVWNTANVADPVPIWTKGANVSGVFTVLRSTSVSRTLLMYAPSGSSGSESCTSFTDSSYHGWTDSPWEGGTPPQTTADGTGIHTNVTLGGFFVGLYKNITAPYLIRFIWGTGSEHSVAQGDSAPTPIAQLSDYLTADSNGYYHVTKNWVEVVWNWDSTYTLQQFCTNSGSGANAGVSYSNDNGNMWNPVLDLGSSPGSVGGFDTQKAGTNSFAAANGAVYRATTLGGAYSSYYAITGAPPQATCIIVPYYDWNGAKNTNKANPDIIVGLSGTDGSSRTLLWIEGGATPGTVHDLTPVANYVFDNPNAITVSYNHHIACMGKVSGTYTLRTTVDKGSTWVNQGTLTSPMFIRTRRNDTTGSVSGTNKGQIYLAGNNVIDYSSKWFTAGLNPRTMPVTGITMFDTVI